MKRILLLLSIVFSTLNIFAQDPIATYKNKVDTSITNKTGQKSITPITVGGRLKDLVDLNESRYLKIVDTTTMLINYLRDIDTSSMLSRYLRKIDTTLMLFPYQRKISANSGTATSIGLSLPSIFTVTNSPVTTVGTLTGTFISQSSNAIFAGPTSGSVASPSFRALVPLDLGIGTATSSTYLAGDLTWRATPLGSVISVGLSAPSVFSVSGSPITSSGTLGLSFATGQTANQVLASPNGSTGALSLRTLVAADLPSLATLYIQNSTTAQTGNFNISGTARIGGFVNIGSVATPISPLTVTYTSGNQLSLVNGAGNELTNVGNTGVVTRTATGSAASFVFLNATEITGGFTSTATTSQLFIRYDASHYESTTVASTGSVTRDLIGTSPTFTFAKTVTIAAPLNTTGRITATLTTEQLRVANDVSNYLSLFINTTGNATIDLIGTTPTLHIADPLSTQGGLWTGANADGTTSYTNSNFGTFGGDASSTSSTASILFGGASTVNYRAVFNGVGTSTVVGTGNNFANVIVGNGAYTTAGSGFHAYGTNIEVHAPTVTSGTAQVGVLSSILINSAPTIGQRNYSLYAISGDIGTTGRYRLGLTPAGTGSDSVLVKGADSTIRTVAQSSLGGGTPTLASVTAATNGNNTFQLLQIKGTAGATLPGYALEVRMDSTSTPTSYINSINRPTNVPIPLNIQTITGSYASPATTQIGSGSNSITRIATGTGSDSAHTNVVLGASISLAQRYTTANTTLTSADNVIIANNSSGAINIVLPTASSSYASGLGRIYTIVKKSAALNNVVIVPITGSTISGQTSLTLAIQYSSVTIQSDGTDWFILSSNVGGASL